MLAYQSCLPHMLWNGNVHHKTTKVKKKSEAQFRPCLTQTGAILASDFWVDLFCCLRLLLELAHTTSTIQPERERPLYTAVEKVFNLDALL